MSSTATQRSRLERLRRTVRRTVLARRRLLAALCAGVAVVAGVRAVAAPPPPTVPVTSAARDLAAGTVLDADDVRVRQQPPDVAPDGLAADPVGRTLAAPLRAGEPVTDVRLVGRGLAAAHPELTTLPVRLPDPGLVALLRPGDRIDLVATDPEGGSTRVVAPDALVLATPPDPAGARTTTPPGSLVVLGVSPSSATAVAEASVRWFLSYSFAH